MLLPCDPISERNFIALISDSRDYIADYADKITPDMMHDIINKQVYETILKLARQGVEPDLIGLMNELRDEGVTQPEIMKVITNDTLGYFDLENSVKSIRANYEKREAIKALALGQQAISGGEGVGEAIRAAEASIEVAKRNLSTDLVSITSQVSDYERNLQRAASGELLDDCVATGLKLIDNIIDGLFYGQNHVLCGATGMGKSSTMLAIVDNIISNSGGVYILSSEMGASQLINRLVSRRLSVNSRDLRKGKVSAKVLDNAMIQTAMLKRHNLHIDDRSGVTPSMLAASVEAIIARGTSINLVVIDHLGLMAPDDGGSSPYERTTAIMRDTTIMAKNSTRNGRRGYAVLSLSQVKRGVESRNNKEPQLSDLRDSGNVEQDSYMVLGVYRDEYYTKDTCEIPDQIEVIVMKNREGETGRGTFYWDRQCATVRNGMFKEVIL